MLYLDTTSNNDNSKELLFHRLDQILGKQGSKAKDVYASKISLASRVVKVERQVRIFCLDSKRMHSNHRCMKFMPTFE
jgi:hypothetical protein